LGDVYAHEVHRTVEHIVERDCRFGSHQDLFGVGDRAGRARLRVGLLSVGSLLVDSSSPWQTSKAPFVDHYILIINYCKG
jgi:hypothetical protein